MSRYAKVDTRMWGDEKYRALSRPQPNAQTLFTYLLTGPHNLGPGCFEAGEYGLAEKLRWPIEGFRAAFAELETAGMVRADWDAQVVWLVNAVNHDPPTNANVVKHWLDLLDTVPECLIRSAFLASLEPFMERFQQALQEPAPNGKGNPSRTPKPKPEPFPKPEPKEKETRVTALAAYCEDFLAFFEAYPKHENKKAAYAEWLKIRASPELVVTIMAAVEEQKKGRKWIEGFANAPDVWLRGAKWDDEPEPLRRNGYQRKPGEVAL